MRSSRPRRQREKWFKDGAFKRKKKTLQCKEDHPLGFREETLSLDEEQGQKGSSGPVKGAGTDLQ